MSDLAAQAQNFNWLLTSFVENTAGVAEALAVSSDGLLLASSMSEGDNNVEQFAAVTAGLSSLTKGAADCFGYDSVQQVIVEMSGGFLFISTISDGSVLAVLTTPGADLALVGYEITLLVDRAGAALSPELIAELKNVLTV